MASLATRPQPEPPPPQPDQRSLVRQLETLQQLADSHRDEFLGQDWFGDVRSLYNLTPPVVTAPSFRPPLQLPQLQMLALMEASDLADSSPKVYITGLDGKRDRAKENAFNGRWRQGFFDLSIMYASIWSLLGGTGFLQVGIDPYNRSTGKPTTFVLWRDPSTVHPDPAATSEDDWYYIQITERLWPDEVRRRFPRMRARLRRDPVATSVQPSQEQWGTGRLTMPPGPMSTLGQLPEERAMGPSDGRLGVRYTFIYDANLRERVRELAGSKEAIEQVLPSNFELAFPNGRYIVDVEGEIAFDGDNPHPMGIFPVVRVLGLPAITSFWGLPPSRITLDLQNLAIRMLKQVFENAVRLNNGCWFIDEASGLTAEDFGGLPGEIRVVASTGKNPELKVPPAFPAHFLEYPKWLLAMQKELWGFGEARQGKSGAGNVGTDLFDSAVMQSQVITRLRGKLLAVSLQRLSSLAFYHMARFETRGRFPSFESGFQLTDWKGGLTPPQIAQHGVYLDPASVRPLSASALRRLVPQLRQMQMLDTRTGLELLDIPGAGEIADQLEAEKALEALARLKRR